MELYQLRTFVAVAQQGHLTQAAELLHLSQPAVTAQIKALEEELGVSLFERYPGGVQLTEAGKTLLPDAEQMLALSRSMLNRAKSLVAEPKGKVRIGTIGVPARLKLGPWLACLKTRYPLLTVQTAHGISGSVLNEVRKKTLDGGFYLGRNPYQNVNTLPLTEIRFCVALPPQRREELENADWRELGRAPWLGVSQFSSISAITQEVWRMQNIAPRKVGESDEEAVLVELVKSGLGVALLAERTAHRFAADGSIALWRGGETVISAPLQFIYSAEREEDPLLAMLRETLLEVWQPSGE
ncbi:DNA-binding transcriptional regulator, LysR family [Andreprevotia lacus DSM 23236]|jgi:DNA-binding transcriptional LysR family regulator|uniref:DNA-binding transcriptional regulator, LysR family n=1 Tax=Andreprevotia lacus DSM 23236 TaxID=1121001 RepID=A0A1W1XQD7_9NEIS|nr:LysR family transcriptional regulator [Andreprevotia lacus]SMC26189.1 DNA-binding transcriptional regulator, LysR family [Andreprevotia lacus DSM 23236]